MTTALRALAVTIGLTLLLLAAGCSSHEAKFEDRVPPRAVPAPELVEAAARISQRYRSHADYLAADALAPLTQATAVAFQASGAPRLRTLTRRYADILLEAQLQRQRGSPFFGSERPGRADAAITAEAVDALTDAYIATRDVRYRDAAVAGARALESASLGVERVRGGLMLRESARRGSGLSVALTAKVAHALRRAADPFIGAPTAETANEMLDAVARAQESRGRWFAFVGREVPMTMESWSTTLLALASVEGQSPVDGIADAGIPALFEAGFTTIGEPDLRALPDPDGYGPGLAISAFDAFEEDPTYARLATRRALERRRDDGTVVGADRDDARAQAIYALGFARRALSARSATN